MALVRKTDKLKTEILGNLKTFTMAKVEPTLKNLRPILTECLYEYINSELFYLDQDLYNIIEKVAKIDKNFIGSPQNSKFVIAPPTRETSKTLQFLNHYGTNFPKEQISWKKSEGMIDKSSYDRQELLLPPNFDSQFNVTIGPVHFNFESQYGGDYSVNMILIAQTGQEVQDDLDTNVAGTHLCSDEEIFPEELRARLEAERTIIDAAYNATRELREYIFDTLWPNCASLNAMIKYYPGITEFIDDDTNERLFKRTGNAAQPVPMHLAPPQEVLVTTAKHKMLKKDDK